METDKETKQISKELRGAELGDLFVLSRLSPLQQESSHCWVKVKNARLDVRQLFALSGQGWNIPDFFINQIMTYALIVNNNIQFNWCF